MPRQQSAVSTYGYGRTTVPPVYGGLSGSGLGAGGGGGKGSVCTSCEPNVPYVTTMLEFVSILESFKSSIERYFPNSSITSPFEARFETRGTMDVRLFARVEWVRLYKPVYGKFDVTNISHINALKDVFLGLGYDWRMDKWLSEWKSPDTQQYWPTRSATATATAS